MMAAAGVKRLLTTMPNRKPAKEWWVGLAAVRRTPADRMQRPLHRQPRPPGPQAAPRGGVIVEWLGHFDAIWCIDFEFNAPAGERPSPVCMVGQEFFTKRRLRVWQ